MGTKEIAAVRVPSYGDEALQEQVQSQAALMNLPVAGPRDPDIFRKGAQNNLAGNFYTRLGTPYSCLDLNCQFVCRAS
jgi:hypothetical protein